MQSEETEIPSLVKERKLKTKCFFLKSRKEAASVEFFDGGGEWRGTPQTMGSQAWWGWVQIPCSHELVEERGYWNPDSQDVSFPSGGRPGASEVQFSTPGRMQGRPKGAPEPLFSWNPHGPLPNDKLPDRLAGSFMRSQPLLSAPPPPG